MTFIWLIRYQVQRNNKAQKIRDADAAELSEKKAKRPAV